MTVSGASSVTTIGEAAFSYCGSLTAVSGFSSVTTLGTRAFNLCNSLDDVGGIDFSKVTSVGESYEHHAFFGCNALLTRELNEMTEEQESTAHDEVLAYLRERQAKGRKERRHELLVCAANARREQDAGRGEGVEELLGNIAKLPPEVVREYLVKYLG
jgi:hypothetical protein